MNQASIDVDVSILRPVLEDNALMAMIRQRHVPFAFVVKQAGEKLTEEGATKVANALIALRPGNRGKGVAGVIELDVNFSIVNKALHISGGILDATRGVVWVKELTPAHIADAIGPESRSAGREFALKRYKELKIASDLYDRVLRECERSESLDIALSRVRVDRKPMEREQYERIKGAMNRYGLMREPIFARPLLIEGVLAREIEQQFVGERLEDVAPRLMRQALAAAKKEPRMPSA